MSNMALTQHRNPFYGLINTDIAMHSNSSLCPSCVSVVPNQLSPLSENSRHLSQLVLCQAREELNLSSPRLLVKTPSIPIQTYLRAQSRGKESIKLTKFESIELCQIDPEFESFCARLSAKLDMLQANLWDSGIGGSSSGVELRLDDSILSSITLSRSWTKQDLSHIKCYLEDMYTFGQDWQLFVELEDPWNGTGAFRPRDAGFIKIWYRLQHHHSQKLSAIPQICKDRMAAAARSKYEALQAATYDLETYGVPILSRRNSPESSQSSTTKILPGILPSILSRLIEAVSVRLSGYKHVAETTKSPQTLSRMSQLDCYLQSLPTSVPLC